MAEYKKSHTLSTLQQAVDQRPSTKGSAAQDSLLKSKLQEDNLYTVLYAYVRKFAPTPDYMLRSPRQESAAKLKKTAYDIAKELQKRYHINLMPVVEDVMQLVNKQKYNEAKRYILERVRNVEQEIKALE